MQFFCLQYGLRLATWVMASLASPLVEFLATLNFISNDFARPCAARITRPQGQANARDAGLPARPSCSFRSSVRTLMVKTLPVRDQSTVRYQSSFVRARADTLHIPCSFVDELEPQPWQPIKAASKGEQHLHIMPGEEGLRHVHQRRRYGGAGDPQHRRR